MVLIDKDWKELSNGGHIVFWSNLIILDLCFAILDAKPDPSGREPKAGREPRAVHKVASFLTDSIVKFGSNEAEYTPNR